MSDQYQWWRDAIAGNVGEIHADHPQSGYFKIRDGKDGPWLPVAIWQDANGDLKCRVADKSEDALRIWTWAAKNPVEKNAAKIAFETGAFPGDVPRNSGELTLTEEIADAVEQAQEWLSKNKITDKVSSDTAANWRQRLLDLAKKADKQRESEKRPHDEAAKAVQAKWKPSIDAAEDAADSLRSALTQYMRAEEARQRAEAEVKRKAAEEEARKQREAAETARREAEAKNLPPPPEPEDVPLPFEPEPVKVQAGGQRGRKTGLRTVTTYVVTDLEAAWNATKHLQSVRDAVEKAAAAMAKAGATVPGVEKREERVAA